MPMRRLFSWQLPVLLLLAGMAAQAQVANHPERQPPKLPPDQFNTCVWNRVGVHPRIDASELMLLTSCESELQSQKRTVLKACLNPADSAAPPRVIQACTESLEHHLLQGEQRSLLLADRAWAYFASGGWQQARADYTAAIGLAPRNADLYYDRGLVSMAHSNHQANDQANDQADDQAALRDFDTSLGINSKLVPALLQRARLHAAQGDFNSALADYSSAILLQPKNAAVWSERGQANLRQRNYAGAVEDEAQAIQFAPRLARAYYLRSVAFGDLGDQPSAFSDLRTAVGLDPSLARYVTIKRQAVLLALPPL
jgi:tetratricopeptide (TPR) repeat protein